MRALKIARLALSSLRRTPLRVILTSLGVAIGTGALVSMVAFALGMQRQAETPFKTLGLLNNIQVSPDKDDDDGTPILDDEALDRMAELPGVAVAYPDYRFIGLDVIRGEHEERVFALGVPREAAVLGFLSEVLTAGRFFSQDGSRECILSVKLIKDLGFEDPDEAIGNEVTLKISGLSPADAETLAYKHSELTVTVTGAFQAPAMTPGFARQGILLPVDLMQEIPGIRFAPSLRDLRVGRKVKPGSYSRVVVRVHHPSDLANVENRIKEMGFETNTLMSQLDEMRTFFILFDVLLAAVGTVALVVAGLGIINTLLMSVLERYQEIGIYKAIGASNGDVRVLFLTEAGMVGLSGGIGGLALGGGVSFAIEIAVNAYARSQGVTVDLAVFAFPFWVLAGAVAFAVGISVIAGVYPASRAVRIDPIRALRGE